MDYKIIAKIDMKELMCKILRNGDVRDAKMLPTCS